MSQANWGTPGHSSQYHIQTDEGPERFFRYQTDNGQFRKEKRLQDGTVIGTNAWIDGLGYLRQNDYIADHEGYRILKSKTVFVGKDRPIEVSRVLLNLFIVNLNCLIQDAMKATKKVPASSGTLVPSNQGPPASTYIPPSVSTTQRPVTSTVVYSSPSYYYPKTPSVFIRPNSHPGDLSNDLDQPALIVPSNDLQSPSVIYLPPRESNPRLDESHLPPIALIPSSTPAPKDESNLPPIAYYPSSTSKPDIRDESDLPPIAYYPSSTANPLESNNVIPLSSTPASVSVSPLANGLSPSNDYGVIPIQAKTRFAYRPTYQYASSSSTVRPISDYNRNTIDSSSYQNRGKSQQYPYYDGVGVTANGFRYYLPRQYQEEVSNSDGSRDGSFGYVDPFGIRRVVYYNAGRNGFIHRKNNRYVGFNSTPYDPRPN